MAAADDYSMPHWINLSFYSSNKKVAYSNFIPRIKLPPKISPNHEPDLFSTIITKTKPEEECLHNSFFDYDAYDAQVFQLPSSHATNSLQRTSNLKQYKKNSDSANKNEITKTLRRKMSDPDIHHINNNDPSPISYPHKSQAITIPVPSFGNRDSPSISPIIEEDKPLMITSKPKAWTTDVLDSRLSPPCRAVVGSAGSPPPLIQNLGLRPGRALINPFDPSHVTIKLTSNRRRWTHIFPKGPTGVLIQQHHYQAVPTINSTGAEDNYSDVDSPSSPVPTLIQRSLSQTTNVSVPECK